MGQQDLDPSGAQKVIIANQLYIAKSHTEDVGNTPESLEEILGEPLIANIGAILIVNTGVTDMKYQTDGTAASGTLGGTLEGGASKTFPGNKKHLDLMRLFKQPSNGVVFDQLVSLRGR